MATEKRLDLIDRKATLDELCRYCIVGIEGNCPEGGCAEFRHISQLPTVDAVEVVHGRWEDVKETSLYVPDMKYTVTHTAETCSACKVRIGFIGSKPYLYDNSCPNCGAKMDGERKNE